MMDLTRIWIDRQAGATKAVPAQVPYDAVLFVEERGTGSRIYLDTTSTLHFLDVVEPPDVVARKFNEDRR